MKDITRDTFLILSVLFVFVLNTNGQPGFSKVFSPDNIGPGSTTTLTFTIDNTGSGSPVTDLAFTDNFPTGMTVAAVPNASHTCNDGTVTAVAGSSVITFSAGRLTGGSSCTITVNVTSSTVGMSTNTTGDLTSSAGNSGTASDDLTISTGLPGFAKSFSPSSVPKGTRSTLTFTIDNTANASVIGNLDFTDNLPTGMVVANPANASTDCISASAPNTTLTAVPGTSVIILDANGSGFLPGFEVLSAGGTCTVVVDVVPSAVGALGNISNDLLATIGSSFSQSSCGKSTAILTSTRSDIHITKEFKDDPTPPGGAVTLDFTIENFDRDFSATGVAFTDDLTTALAGLTFDSVVSNDCGGSVSGVGTTTVTFSGGTVAAQSACTISISCTVPGGATPGTYTNTTGAVIGSVNGSTVTGNVASDDLFVSPSPILTKTFKDDPVSPGETTELEFTLTNTSMTHNLTDATFFDEFDVILPTASALPPTEPCGAGSSFTYTPLNAAGNGSTPAKLVVSGANLTSSSSCTFSITLDVLSSAQGGIYSNTTSNVTGTVNGEEVTGNPATDDLIVTSVPQISKSFLSSPSPGGTVDLQFDISLDADSPSDATNIAFMDDLTAMGLTGLVVSAGGNQSDICGTGSSLSVNGSNDEITFSGGTLSPGGSCSFTVTLTVPANAAPATYTNTTNNVTATVSGTSVTGNTAQDDLLVAIINFTKEFLTDPVIPGGSSMLRFTIEVDANSPTDATNIFFTDNLSAMLSGTTISAAPANGSCGAGSVFSAGGGFLIMTGGTLSPGGSCTFDIEVNIPVSANNNTYSNITSNMSAVVDGNTVLVPPALDELTVNNELIQLEKSFTGNPYPNGSTSANVLFTVTNLDGSNALNDVAFTDDLEAFLSGTTYNSTVSNSCGATISGTSTLDVSNIDLAAGASCTFEVSLNILGSANSGTHVNTTSAPTGTIGGLAVEGPAASDGLVIGDVGFSKSFSGSVGGGQETTLTFTIENFGSDPLTNLDFSDDLDAMITGAVSTLGTLNDVCGAGSVLSGTSLLTLAGGNIPSGSSCTFSVSVSVPCATTTGTYTNTTSDLREQGIPFAGVVATADLTVTTTVPPMITSCPTTINVEGCGTGDIMNGNFTALAYSTTEVTITEAQFTAEGGAYSGGTSAVIKYQDSASGACPIVITRTFTVMNDCGTVTCSQTINIDDTIKPIISGSLSTLNEEGCSASDASAAHTTVAALEMAGLTISDACTSDANLTVSHSDASSGTCPVVVIRTYTIKDECDNESEVTQTINIDDTTKPTIGGSLPTLNEEGCSASDASAAHTTVAALEMAGLTISDACTSDGNLTVSHSDASSGTCPVIVTRTYTIKDECDNESEVTQTINIDDTTKPTISGSLPTLNEEGCSASAAPAAYTTIVQLESAGLTISDACTTDPLLTVSHSDASSGTCPLVITRTYKIKDECDNESEVTQTINIDDTTKPTISGSLSTLNEEGCSASDASAAHTTVAALEMAGLTISDACTSDANLTVSHSDASSGTCPVVVTRTYTIKDECDNESEVTQTINIDDTTKPTISGGLPNLNEEGCSASAAPAAHTTVAALEMAGLTISDACTSDANLTVSYSDASSGTCPIVITRTYSIEDECDNEIEITQTINIDDTVKPSITGSLSTLNVEGCDAGDASTAYTTVSELENAGLMISDACTSDANLMVSHSDASSGTCPIVITRTYTVKDECDNESEVIQTINITDTTKPSITGSLPTLNEEGCNGGNASTAFSTVAELEMAGLMISDACTSDMNLTVSHSDMSLGTCPVVVTRTYTITDECDNEAEVTQTINISDNTPPMAVCQAVTVELDASGMVNITTSDVDNGSSDACSSVTLGLDITSFDCNDLGGNTVTLTVTDECNNSSDCTATITVEDNIAPMVTCKDAIVELDGTGNLTLSPFKVYNSTSDNCAIATLTVTPNAFNCTQIGMHTVTLEVEDYDGNIGDCTATVTVEDNTAPDALCKAYTIQLDSNGEGTLTAADIDDNSSDNCGIASSTINISDFDCSDIGVHVVTLSLVDDNGNASSCTANVTVEDSIDPEAKCKDINVGCSGTAIFINPADVDDGSSDNCGFSLSLNQSLFPCTNTSVTVTLTATDDSGNTDDCTATVNITPGAGATSVTITNVTHLEGNWFGLTFYMFQIERSDNFSAFDVDYFTTDGTATVADDDYIPASGTISFTNGGSLTQNILVLVKRDNSVESDETFEVNLSSTSSIPSFAGPGIGTILNDDGNPLNGNDPKLLDEEVSVSQEQLLKEVPTIFPNPTNGELFINLPVEWFEEDVVKVDLFDNSGRRLRAFEVSEANMRLEVFDLRNGMHHLVFYPKNRPAVSERFIKMQ